MSLRIAREEVYELLPISIDHVISMQGQKNYYLPVAETNIPDWVLNELKEMGSKAAARGLVIIDSGIDSTGAPTVKGGFNVAYSVLCGLSMKNGVQHICFSHIEPVDFNLYWKSGKFYQQEYTTKVDLKKPTNAQMAILDKIAIDLLTQHGIKTAEVSRVNPFLQALLIPLTVGDAKIEAFANDLFHALNLLHGDEVLSIYEATDYCGLDVDKVEGHYLVIFNHPAIFNYPEDSPEGHCAYGEWKP